MSKTAEGAGSPLQLPKPATVEECHAVIDQLGAVIVQLQARIEALEERLRTSSKNSSKPPSSDGPGAGGGNRAARRRSERRRGAQPGHKGHSRALHDERELDEVHECALPAVCECGAPVQPDEREPQRHQVFDIPAQPVVIREYRLHSGGCTGCGRWHAARLPAGVPRGQLGPRALALIGLLATRYHLTQHKIASLLGEVFGLRFSLGTISHAHGLVARALKAPVDEALRSVAAAPVKLMDETRYPREGQANNWAWALVQPRLAVFTVLPSRARYVIHGLIGQQPHGIVSSDRYAGYAHIAPEQRQLCWAHLLRDFRRIAERGALAGVLGRSLLGMGHLMFRWRNEPRPGRHGERHFERLQQRMRRVLERGAAQQACRRTAATCADLLKWWPSLWTWRRLPEVEPTNNDAERALRALVLKRKISGLTRSRRGDEFLARGYSVHESCRRQGRSLPDYLLGCIQAYIGRFAPPSLLPAPQPSS